jgi:CBS domain-containing protein
MDGGRVLRALLATQMDYVPATQAAAAVGQAFAFVMGFVGLFYNPWLILIAVFVYMGAGQEEQQVRMRRLLRNVPLSAVLITRFESLPADESLGDALARAGRGFQHDFPVVSEGRVVGMATHEEILRGLHQFGPGKRIGEIMREDVCMARADASLQDIYDELAEGKCAVVAVMSGDELIGLVTPESVARHLMTVTSHPTLGRLRGAATN